MGAPFEQEKRERDVVETDGEPAVVPETWGGCPKKLLSSPRPGRRADPPEGGRLVCAAAEHDVGWSRNEGDDRFLIYGASGPLRSGNLLPPLFVGSMPAFVHAIGVGSVDANTLAGRDPPTSRLRTRRCLRS